jgi:site-specific DNA recombinase
METALVPLESHCASIVIKKGVIYTKVAKYNGAIPFTYGPLAYFLKKPVYLGETHHGGKWFNGEHDAVDRATFDLVQELLVTKSSGRKAKRSESGALPLGKLYDDRGNLMSPSFSTKKGGRYRFYVSSALLRGRKATAGSVCRILAAEIESAVLNKRGQNPIMGAFIVVAVKTRSSTSEYFWPRT